MHLEVLPSKITKQKKPANQLIAIMRIKKKSRPLAPRIMRCRKEDQTIWNKQ